MSDRRGPMILPARPSTILMMLFCVVDNVEHWQGSLFNVNDDVDRVIMNFTTKSSDSFSFFFFQECISCSANKKMYIFLNYKSDRSR